MKIARELGLAILAGGALWYASSQKNAADRAAAKLGFLEADLVTFRKSVEESQTRLSEAKAQLPAEATEKARPASATQDPVGEPKEKKRGDLLDVLAEHPEVTALMIRAKASQMDLRWPEFFAALKLTPEQIRQFQAIQFAHEEAVNGLLVAARTQGMTSSDPDFQALGKEVFDQTRNQIVALIGTDGFKKMQEYSRTLAVQDQTRELAGLLYATDPLSTQQGSQITQILLDPTLQATTVNGAVVRPTAEAYEAAVNRASKVLSPNQLALFRSKIATMQATQELSQVAASLAPKKP